VFAFPRILSALLTGVLILVMIASSAAPARASFTFEDEQKLGKEFYEKLETNKLLIHDPRAERYISDIGNRIVKQSPVSIFEFRFSVIDSSAINAFATPGGYVYLNRGLITLVEDESELAGVLAHEIAHVNSRHIADIIAKSQKVSIATVAAVLAGAFLGGGGDLSAAVTSFSVAAGTSMNLRYSRQHEEEADRIGMAYLADTGYDPKGMLDFLRIMRRYQFYSNSIPSYFLTHPGTDERIRYLDGLLQTTHTRKGRESIIGNLKRIQVSLLLRSRNPEAVAKELAEELKKNPNDVDILYGLAVSQERTGAVAASLENFHRAVGLAPQDEDVVRELGIAYFKSGKTREAVAYLNRALSLDDDNPQTILYLGRAYSALGDYRAAIALYARLDVTQIEDPDLLYNMAVAYGKASQPIESHYYFGLHFKKKSKWDSSLFHFKEALKLVPEESDWGRRIGKEIEQLSKTKKDGPPPGSRGPLGR